MTQILQEICQVNAFTCKNVCQNLARLVFFPNQGSSDCAYLQADELGTLLLLVGIEMNVLDRRGSGGGGMWGNCGDDDEGRLPVPAAPASPEVAETSSTFFNLSLSFLQTSFVSDDILTDK